MVKNIVLGGVVALSSFFLVGCSNTSFMEQQTVSLSVEPTGMMTKREVGEKHLHTHSLMQQMQRLSIDEHFGTIFSPGSDDALISNKTPETWFEAVMQAQNNDYVIVKSKDFLHKSKTKKITVENNEPSPFSEIAKIKAAPDQLFRGGVSGRYLLSFDGDSQKFSDSTARASSKCMTVGEFLDRMYGIARSQYSNVYFSYDEKGRVLNVSSSPTFYVMTPYKRQLYLNYLNAAGIGYTSNSSDGIAISDNYSNWTKAMNKLRDINKYRHAVYAVHDGRNYFEVGDSNFNNGPITVELIGWLPDGKREYNIYSQGFHRKIDTGDRFYNYYLPDGSKKYLIRFY